MPARAGVPPPQLVVIKSAGVNMGSFVSANGGSNGHPLADLLSQHQASLLPKFPGGSGPLKDFFHVTASPESLDELRGQLQQHPAVAAAFLKPWPQPRIFETLLPTVDPAPNSTPDFTAFQGYLDAAPGGVDARCAWNYPGGGGEGIKIIDVEGAWRIAHQSLTSHQSGITGGTPADDDFHWRNHGTAVLGVINGDRNSFGVTGIAPEAWVRMISIFGDDMDCAKAIHLATDLLSPGDIILVEAQHPGGQRNDYIPMEWWPDSFAAIQYATSQGIIVVEAAGNSGENLDNPAYDVGPFSAPWKNPLRREGVDSGAILVGAGAPPRGINGQDHGDDRSRLPLSNYGSAVDCQGWGFEVTTCGFGDMQGGENEDRWYTNKFSGTSSAAAMVVGVLACVQGALRAAGKSQLGPLAARDLLRTTGSPQQGTGRIGNLPDLREILANLIGEVL